MLLSSINHSVVSCLSAVRHEVLYYQLPCLAPQNVFKKNECVRKYFQLLSFYLPIYYVAVGNFDYFLFGFCSQKRVSLLTFQLNCQHVLRIGLPWLVIRILLPHCVQCCAAIASRRYYNWKLLIYSAKIWCFVLVPTHVKGDNYIGVSLRYYNTTTIIQQRGRRIRNEY